jgi:hypothetical protein
MFLDSVINQMAKFFLVKKNILYVQHGCVTSLSINSSMVFVHSSIAASFEVIQPETAA